MTNTVTPHQQFMGLIPPLLADFYKEAHKNLYPEGTEEIYSIFTPRSNTHAPYIKEVVVFGAQYFVKRYCIEVFKQNFFDLPKEMVLAQYERFIRFTLNRDVVDTAHIAALHDIGYLPLEIKTLPEGIKVKFGTPVIAVRNTQKQFFWLTNFMETLLSNTLWQMMTSATLSSMYRGLLNDYALKTTGSINGVEFQGHDFSMRGMSSLETSMISGAGHLLSFVGTDTMPAIQFLECYYGANIEKELVGTSIPATEHSVMSAGTSPDGKRDEYETYKRIITEVHPHGFVSIVSDTYDFWKVCTDTLPRLKEEILKREGRVVIRPDSGNPVDILCGTTGEVGANCAEEKGLIEVLWDTFGGTTTAQGYKVLNPKIGAIYGDSITLERCEEICRKLEQKGFASTNVVFGIGSYSFQYNTRDTLGFAMKATAAIINGEHKMLYKDPKTDTKKRSHKGRVAVLMKGNELTWQDGFLTEQDVPASNLLQTIFLDGVLVKEVTLAEVRLRLQKMK